MLRDFEPSEDAPWLAEACRLVVAELEVPLIGFVGGPFTLASYLVEGGPSKAQARTKALMLSDGPTWTRLLGRLCAIALASARAQVEAGARAIQVFDSWIGSLSAEHYERHVLGVVGELFDGLAELGVPRVYFGVGTGHCWNCCGAGRGRDRRRLARPARSRAHANPGGCGPPGEPRPGRVSGAGRGAGAGGARGPRAGPEPGTCSTSDTACCRRPVRTR